MEATIYFNKKQSKSLPNEVMGFFGHTNECPTASAFVQQKYKFLHEGWDYLFHLFVSEGYSLRNNTYHGYRLLACDGSDVNIARNPDDKETYIHEGKAGYNAIHVNALYDLMNNTYCDFLVQGKRNCMSAAHWVQWPTAITAGQRLLFLQTVGTKASMSLHT